MSGINAQVGGEQEEVLVSLLWQENSAAVWSVCVNTYGAGYCDSSNTVELEPRAEEGAALITVLPYCLAEMRTVP